MDTRDFLRKSNIKITKSRVHIFDLLVINNNAITADFIYYKLKDNNIDIDISTIYRNLELFNSKGIIEKFDLGDGRYSYIINRNKHKHILECIVCHKEVEIDCPIQQIQQIIKNKTGFTIEEEFDIKLKAICETCREKSHKNSD